MVEFPFKSKTQLRKFAAMVKSGEMSREEFQEWLRETKNIKSLPERVSKKSKRQNQKEKKRKRKKR